KKMNTELSFTTDWTTNNTAVWSEHLARYAGNPGVQALEIGTWEGRSTAWFLGSIVIGKGAVLTTVARDHSRFASNAAILSGIHGDRLRPGEEDSFSFLLQQAFRGQVYEFIYLDGPKDAGDLVDQAVLCWKCLKPGGVLIFDDYLWPGQGQGQFENPPRHHSN